jgi:hypothetical protein
MSDAFDRLFRTAARRGRAVGVCPGAEVLAAYLDNGLTSEERSTVEAHAADCVLCQQHLGLLGSLGIEPPAPEVEAARSWLVRWGWLVPVATAVLVVAIWTRTPEPPRGAEPQVADSQARRNQLPSQPATEAKAESAANAPAKDKTAGDESEGTRTSTPAPGRERNDVATKQALPAAPPPMAALTSDPVAEADRVGQLADATRAPAEARAKEDAAGGARQEAQFMRKSAEPALQATASPTEIYRARGARIDRSRDAGTTWQEAFADASLRFTAAACAQGGPCWFGTATGVVIRTGQGGFVRNDLPERLPVIAIEPGSGLSATVVAGPRRFRTADGGARWEILAP